jgi:hypothetical protein
MTKAEAIKRIFHKKNQDQLSEIWEQVFEVELSAIIGDVFINPVRLDKLYIKEYGEYKGSFGDELKSKFGEEVYKSLTK